MLRPTWLRPRPSRRGWNVRRASVWLQTLAVEVGLSWSNIPVGSAGLLSTMSVRC